MALGAFPQRNIDLDQSVAGARCTDIRPKPRGLGPHGADRFPFRYLNTVAVMHHNHHAKFTGGNFATISLLYDWLFGALDHGGEQRARREVRKVERVRG